MAKIKSKDINIDEMDFNFDINLNTEIDLDGNEPKNFASQFIVICENEKQDDFIRKFFNLGVKTKSGRGKYETNIIEAEKIIKLILELWQKEE
jgi:hypothetical protein